MHDRAMQALYALCARTHSRDSGRQKLLWLSRRPPVCRCPGAVLHGALPQKTAPPGCWKETSGLVSMKSAMTGCCKMSRWTSSCSRPWLKAGYWEKEPTVSDLRGHSARRSDFPTAGQPRVGWHGTGRQSGSASRGDKVNFVRYADDFVVTGATRELLEQKVKPALTAFLQERGLELSEQKTVITHIQTGFDFLGHTVRKYGDKLLITPRKEQSPNLAAENQPTDSRRLGPHPRGAPATTQPAAARLGQLLSQWSRQGRPSPKWTTMSGTNSGAGWPDATPANPRPGRSANTSPRRETQGASASGTIPKRARAACSNSTELASTTIERHLKVQGAANPYDPHYTEYFEQRRCFAWRVRWASRPASMASATHA